MKTNSLLLSATLALSALLSLLPAAQARESHDEDQRGELEHYHHEYYSHSFVDPNYHEDEGADKISKAPRHKDNRRYGRPDSGVSFAFGGHKHHRR